MDFCCVFLYTLRSRHNGFILNMLCQLMVTSSEKTRQKGLQNNSGPMWLQSTTRITDFLVVDKSSVILSSDRPKAGFQRLWLSYLLLVCETKILYTKWHIEYLLHMSNWSPEAFEGQEDQPDIGLLQGPPAGHRSFENILSRCQKEVMKKVCYLRITHILA